jgi:hypothetical protein
MNATSIVTFASRDPLFHNPGPNYPDQLDGPQFIVRGDFDHSFRSIRYSHHSLSLPPDTDSITTCAQQLRAESTIVC